jgi:hypothetical protein
VPKDFANNRLTWTLVANGQPTAITLWTNPPYVVDPFKNAATGNTPPRVRLEANGPELVAGPRGIAATYSATVGAPVSMTVWIEDAGDTHHADEAPSRNPPLRVSWSKYRGPGPVTFDPVTQNLQQTEGQATATATFSVPGEYRLRAQINDASGEGGGGDQCCWTSAHVAVTVRPRGSQ